VNEAEYWLRLEYRVTDELAGTPDRRLQYLWCDGFTPVEYLVADARPRITGRAWICNGPQQAEWDFILFLPHPLRSQEEIDWSALLPAKDVTRWLSVNESTRRIELEPGAAVPDPA
jgi:hypothetical protein